MRCISRRERFDIFVLEYIKEKFTGPKADKIMVGFTLLGELGIFWGIVGLILTLQDKYRNSGAMVFVALFVTTLMGEGIIKNIVKRQRPCEEVNDDDMVIRKPLSYSFPSGHTASSFAVAGVLFRCFSVWGIVFFVIATLIAFSRMYLYVHYPTDIIAGVTLGLLCSQFTLYMFNNLIIR